MHTHLNARTHAHRNAKGERRKRVKLLRFAARLSKYAHLLFSLARAHTHTHTLPKTTLYIPTLHTLSLPPLFHYLNICGIFFLPLLPAAADLLACAHAIMIGTFVSG